MKLSYRDALNVKVTGDERTDITDYSEDELSLLVFNEYWLYKMRGIERKRFRAFLSEYYIFTEEQFEVLNKDLDEDDAA